MVEARDGVRFHVSASGDSTPEDSQYLQVFMSYSLWNHSGLLHDGVAVSWSPSQVPGPGVESLSPPAASGARLFYKLDGSSPEFDCVFGFGSTYLDPNYSIFVHSAVFTQPDTAPYVAAWIEHWDWTGGIPEVTGITDETVIPFQINTEEVHLSLVGAPPWRDTLGVGRLPAFQIQANRSFGVAANVPVTMTDSLLDQNGIPVGVGGQLSGTTTVLTDANGLATFDDVWLNAPGRYKLYADTAGAWTLDTGGYTVKTPGTITFLQQPESGPPGQLAPITIRVVDGQGLPISDHNVSLALNRTNGATLSGTYSGVTNGDGQYTFTSLSIDQPGKNYTLTASVSTYDSRPSGCYCNNIAPVVPVTSKPFDLEPFTFSTRTASSLDAAMPGDYVTFTVAADANPAADQFVLVDDLPVGIEVVPGTLDERAEVSESPNGGTRITWTLPGGTTASASVTVKVRPAADLPQGLTKLVNRAHAEATLEGQTAADDAQCDVNLPGDLWVQLIPSVQATVPGGEIAFGITVVIPAGAQKAVFQCAVPAGTTLILDSVTKADGVSPEISPDLRRIRWRVAAGGTAQVSFNVAVDGLDELPDELSFLETEATASAVVEGKTLTASSKARVSLVRPAFEWSMPPRYGISPEGIPTNLNDAILRNDYDYVNPDGYTVELDATPVKSAQEIVAWDWTVTGDSVRLTAQGVTPKIQHIPQGKYTVKLTITLADGSTASVTQLVDVRDILIVAIGDSYSSGEGNPDHPTSDPYFSSQPYALRGMMWAQSLWPNMTAENGEAHRSTLAASSQAAYQIEKSDPHTSVTFVMVSVSGSTWKQGLSGPAVAKETPWGTVPAQLPALKQILGTREPDILTVSIGGNDIGFADIVQELLALSASASGDSAASVSARTAGKARILTKFRADLSALEVNYNRLGAYLENVIHPKYVLQTDYPDFTIGSNGQPVAFGGDIHPLYPNGIDQDLSKWAHDQISRTLNDAVKYAVIQNGSRAEYGWQLVDVAPAFFGHGYAAADSWFVNMTQSKQVQGTQWTQLAGWLTASDVLFSSGVLHPNAQGLAAYRDLMIPLMQQDIAALLALPDLGLDEDTGATSAPSATSGLAAGGTPAFNATDQLVMETPLPSRVVAGTNLSLVVDVRDPDGNLDTSFNGRVTIADLGQSLRGVTAVTAVDGVAIFPGLTFTTAGANCLLVSAHGLRSTWSDAFTVTAAAATHLVVSAPREDIFVGSPFRVSVSAVDPYGNVDTTFDRGLELTLYDNPGGAALDGDLMPSAVNGVATFSGLTLDQLGQGYTLEASGGGLTEGVSPPFDVTERLVVTTPAPDSITAGTEFSLVVTIESRSGEVDHPFSGDVTLTLADNATGATLAGTLTVAAWDGVAEFADLVIERAGSGYMLLVTCDGLPGIATAAPMVTAGAATQLVITSPPPDGITEGAMFSLEVAAEDALGNVDPIFEDWVTIDFADNSSRWGNLGGSLSVAAVGGIAHFSDLFIDSWDVGYSLQATAVDLISEPGQLFSVAPVETATHLVVLAPPWDRVAVGRPFELAFAAEDDLGNVDHSFQGSATLTLGNARGATLGGTLTVDVWEGVATFNDLTVDEPNSGYTLEASVPTLRSVSTGEFTVSPAGKGTRLEVAASPPDWGIRMGEEFEFIVHIEDDDGALDETFDGSVTISLAGNPDGAFLGGTLTVTATDGVATFSGLTINTPGQGYTLEATSRGLAAAVSNAFDIVSTPLRVTKPAGDVLSGAPFDATVYAVDRWGTLDTSFNDRVTLGIQTSTMYYTLAGTLTVMATGGVACFSGLTLDQAGSDYRLVAIGGGLTSGPSPVFSVKDQLVVTSWPTSIRAGNPFSIVVLPMNKGNGRMDYLFNGNVTASLTPSGGDAAGAALQGTVTVAAVNGVATFPALAIDRAGTYTLTLSGPDVAGTSVPIQVTPGVATQLAFTAQPPDTVATGGPISLQVTALDAWGNIDSAFSGMVTVALGDNPGDGVLGGTLSTSASNGVAVFSDLTIDQPGSGYTLQATASNLTSGSTDAFTVVPVGLATRLVVTSQPPGRVTTGSDFGFVVTAVDFEGHVATAFDGSVSVAGSTGLTPGVTSVNAINGVATFTGLTINVAAACQTLTVTAVGLAAATTNCLAVNATAATHLAISAPNADILPHATFGLQVRAEDPHGNVDPQFNGPVTLALSANPGAASLNGTLTVTAVDGVATFAGLTLDKPGSGYQFQALGPGLAAATGAPFSVMQDRLVVASQPPGSVTAGSEFGLVVQALDGTGAVDTSFQGLVTVASAFGAGELRGQVSVAAANGVASFSRLMIDRAGVGNALIATGDDLVAAISSSFDVVCGPASQLAVLTRAPSQVSAAAPFEIVLAAEDTLGNLQTTFHGDVTLVLAENPAGATLSGTLTATAINGVATFSGLTIDKPGSYVLQASSQGLTPVTTDLEVRPVGVATQLVVTAQPPPYFAADNAWDLTVTAQDSWGNVDLTFSGSVTVSSPWDAPLAGVLTVVAVDGVATFSGVAYHAAGSNNWLQVSSTALSLASTDRFTVFAAAATHLSVWGPDHRVESGSAFDVTVVAEDPYGNVDASFRGSVSLTLGTNPSAAELAGTVTATAVLGGTLHSGLTLDKQGAGYTLVAQSEGLTSGISHPFDVTATGGLNAAPVLDPIGNRNVDELATLEFTATATDQDLPVQTLTYSLDAASLAAGMMITAGGVFRWTPTEPQGGADYPVTLTVTDNGSNPANLTDTETFTIHVAEVNLAPRLAPIADQAATWGQTLSLTVTATDADSPPNRLTYSLDDVSAGLGMTIEPSSGLFRWTPTWVQGSGNFTATVTVTDSGTPILTDARAFTIVVTATWQNPRRRFDVDDDGSVAPKDVLILINDLNAHGARELTFANPPTPNPPPFLDPDGDGQITPSDALAVINYINSHASGSVLTTAGGEGEASNGDACDLEEVRASVGVNPNAAERPPFPTAVTTAHAFRGESAPCAVTPRRPCKRMPWLSARLALGDDRYEFEPEISELEDVISVVAAGVARAVTVRLDG